MNQGRRCSVFNRMNQVQYSNDVEDYQNDAFENYAHLIKTRMDKVDGNPNLQSSCQAPPPQAFMNQVPGAGFA